MTTTPAVGWVTSRYGKRKPPKKPDGTYGTAFHRGVDIGGPAGTPVVAPEAGTVTYIGRSSARGLYVIVDHGRYRTLHQHLDTVTVWQGQVVTEGQQIGVMGSTGGVARHLHTEVHDGTTPIDPDPWYAARGVILGSRIRVAGVQITAPPEDDMPARLIRHPNGSIAIVDGPTMTVLTSMDEVAALRMVGQAADDIQQLPDGLAWNLMARIAARQAASMTDPPAVAAAIAPLLVSAVVEALADDPDTAGLTEAQVQAAAEVAVRRVLGSLD